MTTSLLAIVFIGFVVTFVFKMIRVVPQQEIYVVERVGKYHRSLEAGLHITIPFVDVVRYKHLVKEIVLDIPEQVCITKDNVQVNIDGVLFFRVTDAARASYGVNNYVSALIQLAQTTLRSEIGKIELDRTFEERERVNRAVVTAIDHAADPWGVKVLRYEIKSITPPKDVIAAMEKQMRAEREKRAVILESEGERDGRINRAEGQKQEIIKASEASKQRQINEAEGQALAILSVTKATSEGLNLVSASLNSPGGELAARLRVAEEYMKQFGNIAQKTNTVIIPGNVGDIAGMVGTAMALYDSHKNQPSNGAGATAQAPQRPRVN